MPADSAKAFVINGNDTFRGMFVEFVGSLEHRAAAAMAAAHRARRQLKKKQ